MAGPSLPYFPRRQPQKEGKDGIPAQCSPSAMGFAEAYYMATITLTTVGFGDYQPRCGQSVPD
eukprot:4721570-Amphidinium_carterae.1